MLAIRVKNVRQSVDHQHAAGELVVGRAPDECEPHVRVDDGFVSRRHLLLEQISPFAVRLQNIGRNDVQLSDGRIVTTGCEMEVALPASMRVGETTIHFDSDQHSEDNVLNDSDESEIGSDVYATITQPICRQRSAKARTPLAQLGKTPIAAELALWFETLLSVQRSAFGSSEFYQETAQAIVDLIGLDRGLVLLREGEEWKVRAAWPPRQNSPAKYSRSVLKHVAAKQRTYFGNPQESVLEGASLAGVEAVVGSPIFDSQGSVAGVLYGSKDFQPGDPLLNISELEAQLVQLLASSISSGLHRQKVEQRLRQSEHLAAVGQAMGYITHDLRGPLGNVRQLVEMLRRNQVQEFSREEQLDLIEEAVEISLDLLNDTLEFCRGRIHVRPRRGRFHDLFKRHLRPLRMTLEEYGVDLQIDVPPDTDFVVDPDRMARVLGNLAKNAAEALRGRSGASVTIGAQARDEGVQLWVADNGPGLPDEVRERIFQPFASHGKKGGTGFGLAIAKQLVEAHGGTIEVESDPRGTRFTIELPALEVAAEPAAPKRAQEFESGRFERRQTGSSVLLADDDVVQQRLTKSLLTAQGHQVAVACNGRKALEAWERGRFDFILMDVQMPEMDGLEAASAIRERERQSGGHIPIIAMTAGTTQTDRDRCLAAGMDGYVVKPVERDRFLAAIEPYVSKERAAVEADPSGVPQFAGTPSAATDQRAENDTEDADEVWSLETALRSIPGGIEGVKELAPILVSECSKQLEEIRAGLAEQDARKVERGAHTIKGSADVFAAMRVVRVARRLEEFGRRGDLAAAPSVLNELESELARLRNAIELQTAADRE